MKTGKVYLYGVIGYDWWTDTDNTANRFINDLNAAASDNDEVEVHINSVGGDVHEGMGMISAIRDCAKPVHVVIDGVAYSMASVIALAGSTIKMASNGLYMVHSASTFAWGNSKEMRSQAEMLEKYDQSIADSFSKRLDTSMDEVLSKYFDGEDHFFTATEAKEEGFIDEILDNVSANLPEGVQDMAPLQVAAVLGRPKATQERKPSMINKLMSSVQNFFTPQEHKPVNQESMKVTSKMLALVAAMGLSFRENEDTREIEVTDEVTNSLNNALAGKDSEIQNLQSQVDDLIKERDNLQTKVTDLEGQAPPPSAGGAAQDPPRDGGQKSSWEEAPHNQKYAEYIGYKN